MLHTESIERHTLDVLNGLMQIEALNSFDLVGGTALSLKYGHRLSIDLDLFSKESFENAVVFEAVTEKFPTYTISNMKNPIGLFGYIDELKVDLVNYHKFPLIEPVDNHQGIRMISDADLAAMKIFALLQRARKKDLFDISLLLDLYGLEKIIEWYYAKYPNNQMLISVPAALVYFVETEHDENPVSLTKQTWNDIKKNISKHVNKYLQ